MGNSGIELDCGGKSRVQVFDVLNIRFLIPQRNLLTISNLFPIPTSLLSPANSSHQSTFCFYRLISSRNFINACMLSRFSCVRLFATPWTVARQAPLSMGFSRRECWSGLPCSPLGDLPSPGIEPASPALQADSLLLSHWGSPIDIESYSLQSVMTGLFHFT